jgi:D-alanyl-D-alanine carboxypeptidase
MIAYIRDLEPDFAPGTQTSYSNTNVVLLGMVIEQVTGRSLADVIDDGVLAPLGLTDTITPSDATFPGPHARGYTVQGQEDGVPADATDWNPTWGWATGSMISTLDDLLVYGRELVAARRC